MSTTPPLTVHPVHLVGAGPGDPELLTLKAARVLREATVVLVDDLVGEQVLASVLQGTGWAPRLVQVGQSVAVARRRRRPSSTSCWCARPWPVKRCGAAQGR